MAMNGERGEKGGIRSMESNHKQLVVLRCKLVIVGEAAVGKTALTQVFTSGGPTFPKNYLMVRIACCSIYLHSFLYFFFHCCSMSLTIHSPYFILRRWVPSFVSSKYPYQKPM